MLSNQQIKIRCNEIHFCTPCTALKSVLCMSTRTRTFQRGQGTVLCIHIKQKHIQTFTLMQWKAALIRLVQPALTLYYTVLVFQVLQAKRTGKLPCNTLTCKSGKTLTSILTHQHWTESTKSSSIVVKELYIKSAQPLFGQDDI